MIATSTGFSFRDRTATMLLKHRKDASWQQLADNYNLTYLPGHNLIETRLFGPYRNCLLTLKIEQEFDRGNSRDFTFLTLSSANQVSDIEDELATVETIKSVLNTSDLPVTIKAQINLEANGGAVTYKQPTVEYDRVYLQVLFDYMSKLLWAYPTLIKSSAEFVPILQTIARYKGLLLQPFAAQVLRDLNILSTSEEPLYLICKNCCVHYKENVNSPFDLRGNSKIGCPICHQNQGYFVGRIIAVLDHNMPMRVVLEEYTFRINWLVDRVSFDFDDVEIMQASDEDVERFVVQAGNHTDAVRKSRYKAINCMISPECELSENTKRILQRMFGELET